MGQYAIYLRKSRTDLDIEQSDKTDILERHEKLLLELSHKYKLNVIKIFKEVVSGDSISSRPQMQTLLSEVEQGAYNGVLVVDIDRLARGDTIDQGIMAQTFKYSGTKIITPMKIYDPYNEFDEEYFEFGLFMSRREYKTINRRLQRGRLASVKEGKYVANQPPYGYKRKKLEHDKGYTLELVQDEAEIVKFIYEIYVYGEKQSGSTYNRLGVSRICQKLNNLRILPRKSNTWAPGSVRDILINPVYNGKIRWNWRPASKKMADGKIHIERPRSSPENCVIVDGLHQAIIDDETWNLAQTLMKQNPPHPGPSQYPLKNPLSGIVYCGKCGRSMSRRPYKNGGSSLLMCPAVSCDNMSSRLDIVEKRIIEALDKWLQGYKINWSIDTGKMPENLQASIKTKSIKKIDDEIKTVTKQIENIHTLLEQNVYDAVTFLERSKALSDRIKTIQHERAALVIDLDEETESEEISKNSIPRVESIIEVYLSADNPKMKNSLLKEILEKVTYTKSTDTNRHGSSDDFQIDLYVKIPKISSTEYTKLN